MEITKEELKALFRVLLGENYSSDGKNIYCNFCSASIKARDIKPIKHNKDCSVIKDIVIASKFRKLANA